MCMNVYTCAHTMLCTQPVHHLFAKMLARFLKNCERIVSQGVVFSSCMWSSHVTGFSVDPPLTAHRLQVYV